MRISEELFGTTPGGDEVKLYTLSNSKGMVVKITNLGCIITAIEVPDREGITADVVLGFNDLDFYLQEHPYFGVVAGRFANRIANARFSLDGVEYHVTKNEGNNHLHGGDKYFGSVLWRGEMVEATDSVGVRLSYLSKDGEEGYPGNLQAVVTYRLTEENELFLEYEATTDKPTVINLTNHSYFNLSGEGSGDILGQEVQINAEAYTAVDENLIPTGEIASVAGTPLDLTTSQPIGARIGQIDIGGYDHNYVLAKGEGELGFAAKAYDPASGRVLEVFTTKPGIQFYSGNSLTGEFTGKSGVNYGQYSGFCLEPVLPRFANRQFPNSRLNR